MTEREAYIALNMVQDIGAVTVENGIAALGSAVAFFSAGSARLASVKGIGRNRADHFAQAFASVDWQDEMARAAESSVSFLTPVDAAYPPLLRRIYNPPLALYIVGDPAALSCACLAMIGTRAPTAYGRAMAKSFAFQLAQAGIVIVSGLARGIDAECHAAALLAGGRTVAVIGSALDRLYPPENRNLARRIAKSGGAVITEYPFGRQADRQTFPMRNRIISGLSSAVLAVEAGATSGTLITCDHALEQGRSVLAIPGRIDNPAAKGCHKIIKDGARLVETPEEVLDELQSLPDSMAPRVTAGVQPETAPSPAPKPDLDETEVKILAALGTEEMTPDELLAASGLAPHVLGSRLISLEIKSQIERVGAQAVRRRRI
ncbi:MAG: DNA-processing protein DprA [Kiritimatiellia bacterium]|jgi:DNA processing protein